MRAYWTVFVMTALVTTVYATPPPLPPAPTRGEAASRATFERYQVILDRQPFGDLTPPVVAEPAPPPPPPRNPEESFVRNLRMVLITDGPDGLRVGLVSVSRPARPAQPARRLRGRPPVQPAAAPDAPPTQQTYYLRVGETSVDGITLVDANYDEEKALLRKDDEEHWISMGGGVAEAPTPQVAGAVPRPTSPASTVVVRTNQTRTDGGALHQPTAPTSTVVVRANPQAMSYAERQKWREEVIRRRRERMMPQDQDEESEVLTPEERHRRLQELNMDLIRARGEKGAPLPIQLTLEQDNQLVKEGVLPAPDDESEE